MIHGKRGGSVDRDGNDVVVIFPLDAPEDPPVRLKRAIVRCVALGGSELDIKGVSISSSGDEVEFYRRSRLEKITVPTADLLNELL